MPWNHSKHYYTTVKVNVLKKYCYYISISSMTWKCEMYSFKETLWSAEWLINYNVKYEEHMVDSKHQPLCTQVFLMETYLPLSSLRHVIVPLDVLTKSTWHRFCLLFCICILTRAKQLHCALCIFEPCWGFTDNIRCSSWVFLEKMCSSLSSNKVQFSTRTKWLFWVIQPPLELRDNVRCSSWAHWKGCTL